LLATALAGCTTATQGSSVSPRPSSSAASPSAVDVSAQLTALEGKFDAKVGVNAVDTASGRTVEYRDHQRFGYASTLKAFAAAEMLATVPGATRQATVKWTQADVTAAGYTPVTERHIPNGLSLDALAEAAVRDSDNEAENLVLDSLGGPRGLDTALERLGDKVTDVVHTEPALNTLVEGSTADTTTPAAFTADLRALTGPEQLSAAQMNQWMNWMSGNATGNTLIRAGAPAGWTVAEKSGGAGGMRNDVAIVNRPSGKPILITILTKKNDPIAKYDDALVAQAAHVVLGALN
jgi:beta-lactamase class A